MQYYVGLDVSLKSTHICIMDQDRRVMWRGSADTQLSMIAERLKRWKDHLVKVGLETGSLTPWLYHELKDLGFPIICMDARRAADALKARPEKTDKADAQALAEMLASGWYSAVHVKTMESHRLKALLGAREQLVNVKRQLYGQVRGLLRPFGIKISARAGGKRFDEEVRSSCNRHDALYIGIAALLDTLARVEVELAGLDKKVRQITAASKPCWHLMSVPGVGPLTSLAFVVTVEDPQRFGKSRSIASYVGLTPKRYQSGDRDVTGSISKQGDDMLRHYLYEAAGCLLTTVTAPSALRSWGLKLAKRLGPKRARTAVARKLAVLLLGLWKREDHFQGAALVMPWCDTNAMTLHLAEISRNVAQDPHAVLILDQAGWHMSTHLVVPDNITLLALPSRSPELNPVENIWQFMRDNWLSNRVFKSYDDIVEHCCHAWRQLTSRPWHIMSIANRDWTYRF